MLSAADCSTWFHTTTVHLYMSDLYVRSALYSPALTASFIRFLCLSLLVLSLSLSRYIYRNIGLRQNWSTNRSQPLRYQLSKVRRSLIRLHPLVGRVCCLAFVLEQFFTSSPSCRLEVWLKQNPITQHKTSTNLTFLFSFVQP